MSLWSNTDTQASKPKFISVGQVDGITIANAGTGYTNGTVSAVIDAPPVGGVQAAATVTIVGGSVTAVTITNPGAGYTTAPSVTFSSGGGASASLTASIKGVETANSAIMFVDLTEAQNTSNRIKGIKTPGWIKYSEYVDNANVTRYKVEPLIAMSVEALTSGDNNLDDTVVGDNAFVVSTQPSNASVTAPAAASFTVAATGATAYQWQLRPAAGGQYANITNGGVYTNATTATLNISDSTGLNGNRYRCIIANLTAGASVTSNSALLTVA